MSVGNDALVGGGDRIAAAGEDADAVTALGQQGCTVSGDIAGATDEENVHVACPCWGDVDIGCWERADGKVPLSALTLCWLSLVFGRPGG